MSEHVRKPYIKWGVLRPVEERIQKRVRWQTTPFQGLPVLLLLPYPSWAPAILALLIPDCLQPFKSWPVCITAHETFSPFPRINLPSFTPDGHPTSIQGARCLLHAAFPDPLQKVQISPPEPQ